MKSTIQRLLPMLVLALTGGCTGPFNVINGSGNVITQDREVNGIDSITLAGVGDVRLTQGDSETLSIQAEDNIMPHILTLVNHTTLSLGFDSPYSSNVVRPTKPIQFKISVKQLRNLQISGAGSIHAASIKTDQLGIAISGAGNISIDQLQASALDAALSGAGNLAVAGQVADENLRLTGLGSVNAPDLECQTAHVTVSGAGNAALWPQASLDVGISGAGSVKYYGSPAVTQKVTGVGSVQNLGAK